MLVIIVASIAIGYSAGRGNVIPPDVVHVRDTVTIRDTIVYDHPVPYEVEVTDTLLIERHSVVYNTVNDTVYIALPMERKVYKDSNYELAVNGYSPMLEYINIFPETKYVTVETVRKEKTSPRFSVGIQAGYGISSGGLTPYIGIGGQFNLFSF